MSPDDPPERPGTGGPAEDDGPEEERGSAMIQWLLFVAGALLFAAGVVVVVGGVPLGPPSAGPTGTPSTPAPAATDSPTATPTTAPTDTASSTPTDGSTPSDTSSPTASATPTNTSTPTVSSPTASPSPNGTDSGSVDARVLAFYPERGSFEAGDTVEAAVTVENTGSEEHTFFVGYSVYGPNGTEFHNADDDPTGTTLTLVPGERDTVTLSWRVEEDAPGGTYDALTVVWKEQKRTELQTKLDRNRVEDAFQVENSTDTSVNSDSAFPVGELSVEN